MFAGDNRATSFVFSMFHMFFVCAFLFRLLYYCGVGTTVGAVLVLFSLFLFRLFVLAFTFR